MELSSRVMEELRPLLERESPLEPAPQAQAILEEEDPVTGAWEEYCARARKQGVVEFLTDYFPELRFPIERGMGGDEKYLQAKRPGGVALGGEGEGASRAGVGESLSDVQLYLYATGGGSIPVIETRRREDFVALVRAILHKNEPADIPDSMGATFINGYVSHERYQPPSAFGGGGAKTAAAAKDRFMILSPGPYSGVPATAMGMGEEEWGALSVKIRLAHESCHYVVKRIFPAIKFDILDELVADLAGLMFARGRFSAADFLLFMGIIECPGRADEGRMKNYFGGANLSGEAIEALRELLVGSAENLESFFAGWDSRRWEEEKTAVIAGLTRLPLPELAAEEAHDKMREIFASWDSID